MKNRTILLTSTLFLLSIAAAAPVLAEEAVAGSWEATIETQRGTNEIAMEFSGSGDQLMGTWSGPRGEEELEDVAFSAGTLTFTRNLEFQGNAISIDYTLTVDGDTMSGKMSTPRGERDFTAKRSD